MKAGQNICTNSQLESEVSVPIIVVKDLNAYYGKNHVLHDINFTANAGEILGLIGPSGCGKTTLISSIVGLHKNFTGRIKVLDKTVPNLKILKDLGFMAQKTAIYENLSARANFKFFGKLYSLSAEEINSRIDEIADLMNLTEFLDKKVASFSGGMKQRVALGIALLSKPKILILDEPTVGIDPLLRIEIWHELRNLARNQNITILVSTHIMDEAENCDQVLVMRNGTLLAQGSTQDITTCMQVDNLEQAFIKIVSQQKHSALDLTNNINNRVSGE